MKNASSFKIPGLVLVIGLSTGFFFANPSSAQQLVLVRPRSPV